jgi:hypothetical protein
VNHWLLAPVLCAAAVAAQADVRDPMRPPLPAAARAATRNAEPVVTAVFIAAGHRTAIVDGRVVHAGDSVRGSAIDAVLDDGIRYHRAGSVHELHLAPTELQVKKPAATPARVARGDP